MRQEVEIRHSINQVGIYKQIVGDPFFYVDMKRELAIIKGDIFLVAYEKYDVKISINRVLFMLNTE